ncbi:lamin tail domain-containing protein [Arthrobacter sp. I2-34]|uniref:Lamin tail domain-containing protein n=1 Tax=Arthrobacter hankyongi TaxID=2904801 RepID=A0ABS9L3G8_9MICC|nr:glycerophosphodiester phosphodiesterase family protein [Arthrobacter hankyongi]MCG2621155.1 lamin tail domain-containing protein [Arthrobacter hankyongi]
MAPRTKALGTVAAVVLSLAGAPAAVAQPAAAEPASGTPLLIGHRGAAGTTPENTVAAFKNGRASGADYFEIDVQLSADGVPFIFHDDTAARTTNVEEVFPDRAQDPVTSFTWAELQQLDAGSYFGSRFAGERIPHLDDAARIAGGSTGVYVEIKSPKNSPGVETLVARELEQDGSWRRLVAAGKVQVLGFDEASNREFARLAPEIPLQQLTTVVPGPEQLASWAGFADSVGTNYRNLGAQNVADVRAAGLALGVYTVNAPEAIRSMVGLGVDAITGDFPIQAARLLRGQKVLPAAPGIRIAEALNNPAGNDVQPENGEYVLLHNASERSVDVSGYAIRDAAGNVLRVGDGYLLAPGGQLRVYTGPGTSSAERYYNGGTASVLNNEGDSLALWTAQDRLADLFAN